eukprot:SAG11_NODE_18804_length_481_cov_0.672775_1_plen_129_part_01
MSKDHPTLLAPPTGFELEWMKKRGKAHFYGWKASAPKDFASLGNVVTTNKNAPQLSSYRCVHKALLMMKSLHKQSLIWTDKGSWMGDDGSIWAAPPAVRDVSHPRQELRSTAWRVPDAAATAGAAREAR